MPAEELRGRLAGRIVYFGSCAVFGVEPEEIEHFRKVTHAKAVCGYVHDVEQFEAASFELLLFSALIWNVRSDAVDNYLQATASGLYEQLGFEFYYGAR